MTPEERAKAVVARTHGAAVDRADLGAWIAQAVRDAVAQERDACANAAFEYHLAMGITLAAAIRARATT